jgi:hypothetical protein
MISKLIFAFVGIAVANSQTCSEVESKLWIDSDDFTKSMTNCAMKNMGNGAGTAICLTEKYGPVLTRKCADCFGNTVACGLQKCGAKCAKGAWLAECLDCTNENGCDAGLDACTGFNQGPPKPTAPPGVAPPAAPRDDALTTTTKSTANSAVSITALLAITAICIAAF